MDFEFVERPNYDEDGLLETVGYVVRIAVEQEDARDQIWFRMEIYRDSNEPVTMDFTIFLDVGTTVALAQLQLLRDALQSDGRLLVKVHFRLMNSDGDSGWVYYVRVHSGYEFPTTMADYYGEAYTDTFWLFKLPFIHL